MKSLFFPKFSRASSYKVKKCGSYLHYSSYKEQVHLDCQNRCVYCDIKLEENGHEGFALDHFKPQELFPELRDYPNNLVISCGKCNRNKSSHWPMGKNVSNTHNGIIGFLDPFQCDRHLYFDIDPFGVLHPLKGPSSYLIELLCLNRPSRLVVRRNRMLSARVDTLIDLAQRCIEDASKLLEDGDSTELALKKLKVARESIEGIRVIRDQISAV